MIPDKEISGAVKLANNGKGCFCKSSNTYILKSSVGRDNNNTKQLTNNVISRVLVLCRLSVIFLAEQYVSRQFVDICVTIFI